MTQSQSIQTTQTSDRIEKQVTLRAPQSRVWKAIADVREFSKWFGFTLAGEFTPGATIRGTVTRTFDEAGMIEHQKKLGVTPSGIRLPGPDFVFCTIESVEPERYFAYRWIPYGIDAEADLANEPTTLVEFRLEPVAEGTRLTIVESGFDRVPAHRRLRAFRMNDGGWAGQCRNLSAYVEGA